MPLTLQSASIHFHRGHSCDTFHNSGWSTIADTLSFQRWNAPLPILWPMNLRNLFQGGHKSTVLLCLRFIFLRKWFTSALAHSNSRWRRRRPRSWHIWNSTPYSSCPPAKRGRQRQSLSCIMHHQTRTSSSKACLFLARSHNPRVLIHTCRLLSLSKVICLLLMTRRLMISPGCEQTWSLYHFSKAQEVERNTIIYTMSYYYRWELWLD